MAKCMAAKIDDVELCFSQHEDIAGPQYMIERCDPRHFLRAVNLRAVTFFEQRIAAGMIRMPVSIENVIQMPDVQYRQPFADGARFGRVDNGHLV